ncbi:MAG: hypothetical protein ACOCZQ_01020 [Nanoarchaeota archaeon]
MGIDDIINSVKKWEEQSGKNNNIIDIEKKHREMYQRLKENSKELCELVRTEYFTVRNIISGSYKTSFTPTSEAGVGGRSPSYEGGYKTIVELTVTPKKDIPIKKLRFEGNCQVQGGDYIFAKIPRYKEERLGNGGALFGSENNVFYHDRKFKLSEDAIEIGVLSRDGRKKDDKYRSVDYKKFLE